MADELFLRELFAAFDTAEPEEAESEEAEPENADRGRKEGGKRVMNTKRKQYTAVLLGILSGILIEALLSLNASVRGAGNEERAYPLEPLIINDYSIEDGRWNVSGGEPFLVFESMGGGRARPACGSASRSRLPWIRRSFYTIRSGRQPTMTG